MPCAAKHRPQRRRPPGTRKRCRDGRTATGTAHQAVRWAAALAAVCLLAACTGAPRGSGHHARSPRFPPGQLAQTRPRAWSSSVAAGRGAAGPSYFIGAGGGGGSRPKITVPPIPPAQTPA